MIVEYRTRHVLTPDSKVEWSSWRPLPSKIDVPLDNPGRMQFEFREGPHSDIVAVHENHNSAYASWCVLCRSLTGGM